jgi:hypothetical protein
MNRSLSDIDLAHTPLEQLDVCRILESLQKNQTLRYLRFSGCKGVKGHRHKFIDVVSTCQSLKELSINAYNQKLSIEEVKLLCQNLLPALNSFTLDGLLDNDSVQILCEKMANNCVLKNLSLGFMEGRMSSARASLGSMLAINSTLDSLNLNSTDLGPNGVEALLEPLTGHATARPCNKSLTHLTIGGSCFKMRQGAGETIAHMLRTNDTLTHFRCFPGNNGLEPSDVCKILESLQKNQTLLSLSLWGCQGVKGPDVWAKMRDLFQMNRSLTLIDLAHTPLEQSDVCKILESVQKNQTLRYLRLSGCKGVKGPDERARMIDLFRMHPCLMEIDLF